MLNFKEAYRNLITSKESLEVEKAAVQKELDDKLFQDGITNQQHNNWLQTLFTKQLIESLEIEIRNYTTEAKRLALTNNPTVNTLLIQASELEKVINYVRTRSPINESTAS